MGSNKKNMVKERKLLKNISNLIYKSPSLYLFLWVFSGKRRLSINKLGLMIFFSFSSFSFFFFFYIYLAWKEKTNAQIMNKIKDEQLVWYTDKRFYITPHPPKKKNPYFI